MEAAEIGAEMEAAQMGAGMEAAEMRKTMKTALYSEPLPTYTDPTGVNWRQHSDGSVDCTTRCLDCGFRLRKPDTTEIPSPHVRPMSNIWPM